MLSFVSVWVIVGVIEELLGFFVSSNSFFSVSFSNGSGFKSLFNLFKDLNGFFISESFDFAWFL